MKYQSKIRCIFPELFQTPIHKLAPHIKKISPPTNPNSNLFLKKCQNFSYFYSTYLVHKPILEVSLWFINHKPQTNFQNSKHTKNNLVFSGN